MTHKLVDLGKFPLGINNIAPDTDLPEESLVSAINVILDKEGNVISRKGYSKLYSGSGIHSLYGNYFAEGSELKQLQDDNTAIVIDTGLKQDNYLAWENILDDYYYSDGERNRIIGKGSWGIPTPPSNPILTETTGKLNEGTYQVTICYQNDFTGEIGGASLASLIDVGDSSGILVTDVPIAPEGFNTLVYVSTQNGEDLYLNGTVPNGITIYTILDSRKSTRILETQFMEPLPGGHILRHFNARLYVARDNVLWFSQAFRYGLHQPSKDFFQFPSKITIVQPVDDGIYVVSDKTYFLKGDEPKNMILNVVSDDIGIEGTGITVGGAAYGINGNLDVGYWFSDKGAVLGLPGGELKQLTEDRLTINKDLISGSTMFKEQGGIRQMVTSFSNKGIASGMAFDTQITSQIIRNGVVIT